jgi:hypothetical protein
VNFSLQQKHVPVRCHSAGDSCRVVTGFAAVAGDEATELAVDGVSADAAGCMMERVDDRGGGSVVVGMEPLRCSYPRVKTTASARVADCINATSVRSGFPKPVMNKWICCGSVSVVSLQESGITCCSTHPPILCAGIERAHRSGYLSMEARSVH